MNANKRYMNSPNNQRIQNMAKNECWADLAQLEQQDYNNINNSNNNYHHYNHRRHNHHRYQTIKNYSKPYMRNNNYNKNEDKQQNQPQRVNTDYSNKLVEQENESINCVVPCLANEVASDDSSNCQTDSSESCVSQASSLDNLNKEEADSAATKLESNNDFDQPKYATYHHNQTAPQMIEQPQLFEQINCNTTGVYNNGLYDYEYQAINAHHLIQQQTPPQFYVYHPYDFNALTGSPLINTPITPQHQAQQTPAQYYTTYQTVAAPTYYYDGTYTPTNMASPFSTPAQAPQQLPQQQAPQQQAIMSSPQQQSTILASYQTPPPPPTQHPIYMTPASITPPTSVSPNQMLSINTPVSNERSSNCNSPQQHQILSSLINNSQTPSQNSYLMYTPQTNAYLAQPYQCHSPSQSYMMFQTPVQQAPQQTPQTPMPMSQTIQPMMFSPYSANSPMMSPQVNTNSNINNANNNSHTNGNKFNNKRPNRFNVKRNFNKFNNNNNNCTSSNSNNTNQFNNIPASNLIFSPLESIYQNNPILNTMPPGTYDDYLNDEATAKLVDPNVTLYTPPPPQIYCDINGTLIGMSNGEFGDYDASNGVCSYGDEYDSYEDNSNSDENDENLACTVCRGRRMCFCYFLKVRYYKFPSFFDLVDHQYKKWRSSLAKAKKA